MVQKHIRLYPIMRKRCKKTYPLLLFFMFSVLGGIFSQNRCVSFIEYGKCKDVLLYIYRQV
ncbi:MAG: hypothetical protein LBG15_13465, partial [Dysgonamonadaceae bacterium]|nr:hypothetical protein [Dysgonamonadaceae bacterium]